MGTRYATLPSDNFLPPLQFFIGLTNLKLYAEKQWPWRRHWFRTEDKNNLEEVWHNIKQKYELININLHLPFNVSCLQQFDFPPFSGGHSSRLLKYWKNRECDFLLRNLWNYLDCINTAEILRFYFTKLVKLSRLHKYCRNSTILFYETCEII
jgi:hypothetical protein